MGFGLWLCLIGLLLVAAILGAWAGRRDLRREIIAHRSSGLSEMDFRATSAIERTFPTATVLSLAAGHRFGVGSFSDIHAAAEFVMGHSIWTHEFAERVLWDSLRAAVLSQYPVLGDLHKEDVTPDTAANVREHWEARLGSSLTLKRGDYERAESPLDSLARIAPNTPVIAVIADTKSN